MGRNTNTIAKGYNTVARKLGDKCGLYRVCDYEATGAIHPRHWLKDIWFSATKSEGYQTPATLGRNQYMGYVDFRELERGDILYNESLDKTYYVGEVRTFEMPIVIQCFNTFSCGERVWSKTTRSYVESFTATDIPCNIQRMNSMSDSTPIGHSHPDAILQWDIETWLPRGLVNLNDKLILDTGHEAQVFDLFYHGQGLTIKCREIKSNPTPVN